MTKQLLLECEQFIRNGGLLTGSSFGRIEIPFCKMMDIDTDDAEQYLQQHRENTFAEQMFAFIDRTGQKDSDIYKKAMIDRRLFSKIRSNKKYIPAKRTVIALCLALELSREDADKLLSSAGYSLSRFFISVLSRFEKEKAAVGKRQPSIILSPRIYHPMCSGYRAHIEGIAQRFYSWKCCTRRQGGQAAPQYLQEYEMFY